MGRGVFIVGRQDNAARSRLDARNSEPPALPRMPNSANSVRDTQTGQRLVPRQAGEIACSWRKLVIPGCALAGNGGQGMILEFRVKGVHLDEIPLSRLAAYMVQIEKLTGKPCFMVRITKYAIKYRVKA